MDKELEGISCLNVEGGFAYGEKNAKQLQKDIETVLNYIENSIPKNKILDKIRERQFELQQEYKDFKDDIELNTLQNLLEE